MGKRLVITEKPSVARDIAAAIGGFTEHDEYLENEDYVVTWALGHLLELAEPQDYDKKYGSWSIKNLPIIPDVFQVKPREGQKKRLDLIRKLGRRPDVDGLVNACDAGREGELIYRRIIEYTGLESKPQQRLWLQSMTHDSIRDAFDHLRPGKDLDRLADAALCRAVGDWLVGMNATRALTQRLKSRGERDAWSAGRVQTPTLRLLVERESEILAHVPRPYWEITGKFATDTQEWEARFYDPDAKAEASKDGEEADADAKPSRIFDRQRVDRIMAGLAKQKKGKAGEKRKKSKQNPPLLFDLTALQREANRRFGFSAKRTLDAAQRLYEGHKLLTYPRTDSKYLPGDYGPTVDKILVALGTTTDYGAVARDIVKDGPQNLQKLLDSTKVSDHFAIVPTGKLPEGPLRGDDERIFEVVVRQFLAALMGPATWSQVERIVEVDLPAVGKTPAEMVRFRATARSLEDPGFHRALGTTQEANALPPLVPGNDAPSGVACDVKEHAEEAKETKPPPRYSEAQMLRMMETAGEQIGDDELADAMKGRGLGTPATRADVIEGLVRKGYARRVEGKVGATSKAMRLMDILTRAHVGALASPQLTGQWEYALQEVQEGKLTRDEMMKRLTTFTREVTGGLVGFEHANLYDGEPSLGTCPSCKQGQVIETAWGYRCTRNDGKDAPCDFIIWKDRAGRYIDRETAKALVEHGRVGPVSGFVDRAGRTLEGTLTLERDPEKDNRWALRVDYGQPQEGAEATPEEIRDPICPCPMHEDCEIIETTRRYVCRKVLEGTEKKGPVLPRMVCHREITVEEAVEFFGEPAKTPFLEGFISKRGRPFIGALVRKETGKHGFEFPVREPRGRRGAAAAEGAEAEGAATTEAAAEKKAPARGRKKATAEAAEETPATKKATTRGRKTAARPGKKTTKAAKAEAAPAPAPAAKVAPKGKPKVSKKAKPKSLKAAPADVT